MRKFLSIFISLLVLTSALGSLFAFSETTHAAPPAESYKYSNVETITGTGGEFSGSPQFKATGATTKFAGMTYSGGNVKLKSGCTVSLRIRLTNAEGTQAKLERDDSLSTPSNPCSASTGQKFWDKTITIDASNSTNATPAPDPNTAQNRIVSIQVYATTDGLKNDDLPDEYKNDTITLEGAGISKKSNKVAGGVETNSAAGKSNVVYRTSFTDIGPGHYKACSTAMNTCKEFDKTATSITIVITASKVVPKKSGEAQKCGGARLLKWVVCPVLQALNSSIKWTFEKVIIPLLEIDPLNQSATSTGIRQIWVALRNLANVIFVLIFLFIIFGNASGVGVDAYTFKKALPRFVIAVVAVQASFFACGILIDIGNVLGNGLGKIIIEGAGITSPGGSNTGAEIVGGIGAVAGLAAGAWIAVASGAWVLVLLALLGFIITMIGFVLTLIFRVLIIYILIIVSPIAITAWVLPNTTQYFNKWRDGLLKAVMMYPIMVALLAIAQALANASGSISDSGGATSDIAAIMSLFAPMLAMAMMPKVFKMAGGVMAAGAGAIAARTAGANKKFVDPLKQNAKQNMHDKNALKLGDDSFTFLGSKRLGQGLARVGSGNAFSFGSTGKRKIAGSREAAESKLIGDYEKGYIDKNVDNVALKAQLESGKGMDGKKLGDLEKRAITRRLGAQNGDKEIISLFENGTLTQEDLRRGLDSGAQSRLAKKAPHIIRADKKSAYTKLSGSAAAELDQKVAKTYFDNALITDEGRFNFVNSAASISQSAGLRASANTNIRDAYKEALARSHEFAGQTISVNGVTMNGHQFLQAFVDANGTVAATEGLSAADIQTKIATIAAPTTLPSGVLPKHPDQP